MSTNQPPGITPEQMAEWRAIAEAATPGPWTYHDDGEIEASGGWIAFVPEYANLRTMHARGEERDHAVGRFIAASRTALPVLLAERDRLLLAHADEEERVTGLRAEVERLRNENAALRRENAQAWAAAGNPNGWGLP